MRDLLAQEAQPKALRPHQEKALAMLRQSLASGNRRVVLQAATGFGKTVVAAKIVQGALAKGNRVLITAPMISLINQTVASFEHEGIHDIGVMQSNHPRTNPLARVQVASVQTLAMREMPAASVVIVDECHVHSEVIVRLMEARPDLVFVGLSATPWAKGMGLLWQDMVSPVTISDLIEGGFLSQFVVYAPDVPDLRGVKVVAGDYAEGALAELMGDAKLVGSVVQTWLGKGDDRPTLCFGVNVAHAKELCARFVSAGVSAEFVEGRTDMVEREDIGRRFRSGETRVICSVRTMTTGVDLPVSCIIDAAPTRSPMLHLQKIGRGLRVNPGTEDLVVLDHAGNSLRLGLVTDIHRDRLDDTPRGEKQKDGPRSEKLPTPCSKCEALFVGKSCPACGHERKPVSGVDAVEGDLVEITGKKRAPTAADKQAFWSQALWLKRERGWSDGRTAHFYREKFGVWPRGLQDVAAYPSAEVLNFEKSRRIAFAKRMEAKR